MTITIFDLRPATSDDRSSAIHFVQTTMNNNTISIWSHLVIIFRTGNSWYSTWYYSLYRQRYFFFGKTTVNYYIILHQMTITVLVNIFCTSKGWLLYCSLLLYSCKLYQLLALLCVFVEATIDYYSSDRQELLPTLYFGKSYNFSSNRQQLITTRRIGSGRLLRIFGQPNSWKDTGHYFLE
jgi:hypothetical protein